MSQEPSGSCCVEEIAMELSRSSGVGEVALGTCWSCGVDGMVLEPSGSRGMLENILGRLASPLPQSESRSIDFCISFYQYK